MKKCLLNFSKLTSRQKPVLPVLKNQIKRWRRFALFNSSLPHSFWGKKEMYNIRFVAFFISTALVLRSQAWRNETKSARKGRKKPTSTILFPFTLWQGGGHPRGSKELEASPSGVCPWTPLTNLSPGRYRQKYRKVKQGEELEREKVRGLGRTGRREKHKIRKTTS